MAMLPAWRAPSPWFTVFCALLVCMCLSLSYWQHRRVAVKQGLQDRAEARLLEPPLELPLASPDAEELQWRRASAIGSYDADAQLLIDNRIHEGRAGFHVITPLELAAGGWVLVNRGWIAAPQRRSAAAAPPPPQGEVAVTGLLAPDGSEAFELDDDPGDGIVWQNLKIGRWERDTGRRALPAVLLAEQGGDGLAPVAVAPDYRADTSRGYRLQWLAFALIALGGWVAVGLSRPGRADGRGQGA